jgi:PIN domain nuclease of toxin-antitoxin system
MVFLNDRGIDKHVAPEDWVQKKDWPVERLRELHVSDVTAQSTLWAAGEPALVPAEARDLIEDAENELLFSVASLWETVIKRNLGRDDFRVDPRLLRRGLLDNGYIELPICSEHVVAIDGLPPIHKDPFDRILVAQATVEGITLLTVDKLVAQYPGPVRSV